MCSGALKMQRLTFRFKVISRSYFQASLAMPLTTSRGINFGGAILSASPTALDGMAQPFELTTTLDKGYFCSNGIKYLK